jgi:uncharacterized repeat protein (TIGR01451 family)
MSSARVWVAAWFCVLVSSPVGAQIADFAKVDTAGDVGRSSAVVFGSDGLPLIAYYDATNGDLKVAHCATVDCVASTKSVVDSAGDVGSSLALAVGADGLGVVAYREVPSGLIKVAHCSDLACTSASIATIGEGSPTYGSVSLAIGSDGLPLIAYRAPTRIAFAHCNDAACSSSSVVLTGESGLRPALVMGSNGLPIFSFDSGYSLTVRHCLDRACAAISLFAISLSGISQPPPPPWIGTVSRYYDSSLALGPDGRVVVVTTVETQEFLPPPQPPRYWTYTFRCSDVECTQSASHRVIASGVLEPALALSPTGVPLVSQRKYVSGGTASFLDVTRCHDPSCGTAQTDGVGGLGIGRNSSIAVGPAGIALIALYDEVSGDLVTAYMRGWGTVDLSLEVIDTPDPVLPGQVLRYDFRVSNTAASAATNIRLHAALPPETAYLPGSLGNCVYSASAHAVDCSPGQLGPGATAVLARVEGRVLEASPGTLRISADVRAAEVDYAPGNNAASAETTLSRWVALEPAAAIEGHVATTPATFRVVLHDTVPAGPPVTVSFATGGGSATPGADYVPAAGVVTFPPGTPWQQVTVPIIGDLQIEGDESFSLQLSNPQGAGIVVGDATGTIVDDDVAPLPFAGELDHGASRWSHLAAEGPAPAGARHYRLAQEPFSSYEIVVDAASGDVQPLDLARLAADGSTLLQSGDAIGTGSSVRLAWINTGGVPALTQLVRLRSGGCQAACAPDDVYRIRAFDTTLRVPRFNNASSQVTVLVLQNPTDRPIGGRAWFWSAAGEPLGTVSVSLASRETTVLDTSTVAPGASGSITIAHDGGYGVLRGKAVALEPATGLAFDTPLDLRPR